MMSKSQNRTVDKHIIWSDMNLNPDDWRDSYKDFLEINEIDGNPNDEHGLYEYMVETNGEYLSDERENLNVQLAQPIIVIGDIGRWNGRVMGYKMIDSGNIKDCLYSDTDMTEWYVDRYGDLRADAVHHGQITICTVCLRILPRRNRLNAYRKKSITAKRQGQI